MRLDQISAALVNAAIDLYLRLAYGDAVSRDKHAVNFPDNLPVREVLAAFVSEDTPLKAWSLRLGSQDYPHMKLMLREAYVPGEFAFCVDRHDCFAFSLETGGRSCWAELQSHNYQLKKAIEECWYASGIPTLRSLREQFFVQPLAAGLDEAGKILLVDNDTDAVAIMEMILSRGGYDCCRATSVGEAQQIIAEGKTKLTAALVDLLLPDGMGPDVVMSLRGGSATQNIPVIIMSGMPETELDYGAADAYLRKPFSANEVLHLLEDLIRRYYEADGGILNEGKRVGSAAGLSTGNV